MRRRENLSIRHGTESPLDSKGRRDFLKLSALAAGAALLPLPAEAEFGTPPRPAFPGSDPRWQATWDAALAVLAGNVKTVPHYEHPVLFEGAVYP
ncbi:MAG TPA: twin-arginine translocation signal domain-containing protein, partial [Acidobacteriaceae bacterium]